MALTSQDELSHPFEPDSAWQESVCAWFLDVEAGVGGFIRWGVHPVRGYGRMNLFAFDEKRGVRFRRFRDEVALDASGGLGKSLEVGSCSAGVGDDGRVTYRWDEPECGGDLVFDAFYPIHGFGGRATDDSNLQGAVYAGHLETSGRLIGTLRIGDGEHHIRALAHRDRSWGPRRIDMVRTNSMFTGTVGPELSFAANAILMADGTVNKVGFVVRDGVIEQFADFEHLPVIDLDRYSARGGSLRIKLVSGEIVTLVAEAVAGQLTRYDDYACSENISLVRWGDKIGFCDNEVSGGRVPPEGPQFLTYVDTGDGLSPLPRPAW